MEVYHQFTSFSILLLMGCWLPMNAVSSRHIFVHILSSDIICTDIKALTILAGWKERHPTCSSYSVKLYFGGS